jgi:hypothetical protein
MKIRLTGGLDREAAAGWIVVASCLRWQAAKTHALTFWLQSI